MQGTGDISTDIEAKLRHRIGNVDQWTSEISASSSSSSSSTWHGAPEPSTDPCHRPTASEQEPSFYRSLARHVGRMLKYMAWALGFAVLLLVAAALVLLLVIIVLTVLLHGTRKDKTVSVTGCLFAIVLYPNLLVRVPRVLGLVGPSPHDDRGRRRMSDAAAQNGTSRTSADECIDDGSIAGLEPPHRRERSVQALGLLVGVLLADRLLGAVWGKYHSNDGRRSEASLVGDSAESRTSYVWFGFWYRIVATILLGKMLLWASRRRFYALAVCGVPILLADAVRRLVGNVHAAVTFSSSVPWTDIWAFRSGYVVQRYGPPDLATAVARSSSSLVRLAVMMDVAFQVLFPIILFAAYWKFIAPSIMGWRRTDRFVAAEKAERPALCLPADGPLNV